MGNIKHQSNSAPQSTRAVIDSTPIADVGVKSAVRVIQVLEYFDQIQRDARVGEFVEHLGFPQSSASALLKSLVQAGYLDYIPTTRSYMPTARVSLLGSWIGGPLMRDGGLVRMMDELSAETGETILLASSSGIYAKYIHVIQATNSLRLHIPHGSQSLLAWSAMGVALLSDGPDDAIRLLVRRTNAQALLGRKHVDIHQALANIEQFRKRGYFFSRGMVLSRGGLICMRLPANSENPGRPLAIGIGGLLDSIESQEKHLAGLLHHVIEKYID